ncbi:hypothetical protein GCM10023149_50240 [Mucilaginibacter gynuensis]|uniref:Uncharacterized protein n=1 Tax=Mucilaginibacter gynuensis TaxID=1302236 RepID=A0ABP8HHP3_9SPHI
MIHAVQIVLLYNLIKREQVFCFYSRKSAAYILFFDHQFVDCGEEDARVEIQDARR